MRTPRSSFGDRLARRLVRLLPPQFRLDFGETIEADLDERVRDDDQRGLIRHDVPSLAKAVVRENVTSFVSALRDDVRYALRMMWRTPGFTATAVAMLALGTGVNAALFSVIDAVMLRTPLVRPEQIALVETVEGARTSGAITPERFATAPVVAHLETPAQIAARQAEERRTLQAEQVQAREALEAQHKAELAQPPPGMTHQQIIARQEQEHKAQTENEARQTHAMDVRHAQEQHSRGGGGN